MLRYLAFFTLIAAIFSSETFGSCAVKPSVKAAAEASNLVFVGKVTKITSAQLVSASYPLRGKKASWEKYFYKTDIASFKVTQVFKGDLGETVEIATSADGDAGYKFEGGTWLKEGETYLVYAYKRKLAGTVDTDWTGYSKDVARELKQMQESFPRTLAAEINEINSKLTPYSTGICGRTGKVGQEKEELDELHRIFPQTDRMKTNSEEPRHSMVEMVVLTMMQMIFA